MGGDTEERVRARAADPARPDGSAPGDPGPAAALHALLASAVRLTGADAARLTDAAGAPLAETGAAPGDGAARLAVPVDIRPGQRGALAVLGRNGFADEDTETLRALAAAAAVALAGARTSASARSRERWLQASGEVTSALLSGDGERRVLELIAGRARDITGAAQAIIAIPLLGGEPTGVPEGGGHSADLLVVHATGVGAADQQGLRLPQDGTILGLAAAPAGTGRVTSPDMGTDPRITVLPERYEGLGPGLAVAMRVPDRVRGVLLLVRARGGAPFTADEADLVAQFAGQAALALQLADARRDAEQVVLLEDRDRIARDLHDLAIQRLFATGMTLQSALRLVDHPQAHERLLRGVDDLDETIRIIRSTIFGLRAREPGPGGDGLRARLSAAVGEAARSLGFRPALRMEGLVDTDIPADVADDVVAVVGEALSNAARHAAASRVEVSLAVGENGVEVVVTDDGVGAAGGAGPGPAAPARGGGGEGLRNLGERARRHGGVLVVGHGPDGGTRVRWAVPG